MSPKAPYADNPLLMSREPLKQQAASAIKSAPGNTTSKMPVVPPPTVTRTNAAQGPRITPPNTPVVTKTVAESNVVPVEAARTQVKSTAKQPSASVSETALQTLVRPVMPKTIDVAEITPPSPAPASVAPAVSPITPVAAVRPAPRNDAPAARFAHAPDYSWLVGEVDVHYRGHKELRFCSISDENSIGGKVRLVDQPQLANLKPGTRIRIEGELVRDDLTAASGEYPRYHIRNVEILDRAAK